MFYKCKNLRIRKGSAYGIITSNTQKNKKGGVRKKFFSEERTEENSDLRRQTEGGCDQTPIVWGGGRKSQRLKDQDFVSRARS